MKNSVDLVDGAAHYVLKMRSDRIIFLHFYHNWFFELFFLFSSSFFFIPLHLKHRITLLSQKGTLLKTENRFSFIWLAQIFLIFDIRSKNSNSKRKKWDNLYYIWKTSKGCIYVSVCRVSFKSPLYERSTVKLWGF